MSGYHTVEGELYTDSGVRVGYQKLDGSELVTSGLDFFVADKPKLAAAIARQKATNGEQPARIMFTGDSTTTGVGAGTNPNDAFYNTTDGRKNSWPVVLAAQKGWQDCSFFGDQNNTRSLTNAVTGSMSSYQTLPASDPRIAIAGSWNVCPNNKLGSPATFNATCTGSGTNGLTVLSMTNGGIIVPNMEVFKADGTSLGYVTLTGTGTGGTGTYTLSAGVTLATSTALTANNGQAFAGRTIYAPYNDTSGSLSFTPTQKITRFKLWYYQPLYTIDYNTAIPDSTPAPTKVNVKVDGTLVATNLNLNAKSIATIHYDEAQDGQVATTGCMCTDTFNIATAGIHTINVSLGSGNAGDMHLYGIEAWDHTNPNPVFMVTGWSGVRAFQLASGAQPWHALQAYVAIAPDFTLLNCTINDSTFNTQLMTYALWMRVLADVLSRFSDMAIVVGNVGGQQGVFDGGNFIKLTLPQYVPFLKALAAAKGASYANCVHIFGVNNFWNDTDFKDVTSSTGIDWASLALLPHYPGGIVSPYPYDSTVLLYDRNHPNLNGHAALVRFYGLLF